ncbi:hypothetical protein BGZ57DRAFT_934353 [Hyaloscypha finlandica]|nr:hypothetical protein BGZ57DRAFT_934353 [Hyaloscypha finlandica]
MSAPLLAGAGPISGGGAFYEASHAAETLSETEEATPPAPKDIEKLEVAAPPPGGGFEIAVDLNSVQPPYIGDDARLTQLRDIHTLFRKWARESSGSGTRISEETLRFLPGISRAVIQFFQEMQRQNERLQGAQETLLAERRQMEVRISSFQKDNETFQDAKRKFKDEIDVLKRDIIKVEELYASTKAQKDSLEEQLNENKARAASDRGTEGSSNKRRREE